MDPHLPSRAASLLLLLAALSTLPLLASARGAQRLSHPTGRGQWRSDRRLLDGSEPHVPEHLTHGYRSNDELEKAMREFSRRCRNISRMYSIGRSVRGVPLWVIEIADKPGEAEAEPAFKFVANMHGDEPVGRELLIHLADWLCDNYMDDPLATFIIRKVHLHILPTMNPDGFSLRRRVNANNVDLNRDFPDQFFDMNDDLSMRQPETKAVMTWTKEHHFTASASLHGGALVVNYPWDGTQEKRKQYYACPDDKAFQYMASIYSGFHHNMSQSTEFPGGITNGAHWYPIYGSMQDWNYIHGSCFEVTVEVTDNKWPKASELAEIWEHNKMSMLNIVANLVKNGLHGRIVSSTTGRPLPASITIKGINYKVIASRASGYYNRVLAPGDTYEVVASMPGYQTKSTHIVLEEDKALSADFILEPEEGSDGTTQVGERDTECSCNGNQLVVDFLRRAHFEMYLAALVVLTFLCLLFRRKLLLRPSNHRLPVGPKRPVVV